MLAVATVEGASALPSTPQVAKTELPAALKYLRTSLADTLKSVDSAATLDGTAPDANQLLHDRLATALRTMQDDAIPASDRALKLTTHLHRLADPDAALDEQR
jgi:hypothetical protein